MRRTLYVHIGPMKTGTSALQSILSKHDNSSLIYPKIALWGPGAHHWLVYNFFDQAPHGRENPYRHCGELLRQIRAESEQSDLNLVISSEVLSERTKKRDPIKFIDALWSCLGRDDWTVEVLLGCREHFQRAASAYSQRIKGKASAEIRHPDEFLVQDAKKYIYAPLVEHLIAAGLKVTILNYHPSETWTTRFLAHLGLSTQQIPDAAGRNVSLSVKALIAKLSANRVLRTEKERHKFATLLKKMPGYYGWSRQMFGQEAMIRAEDHFRVDRIFLREKFDIQLPESELCKPCCFFLNSEALAEIASVARLLGEVGEEIVREASGYVEDQCPEQ